jgi:hypothetical protein
MIPEAIEEKGSVGLALELSSITTKTRQGYKCQKKHEELIIALQ